MAPLHRLGSEVRGLRGGHQEGRAPSGGRQLRSREYEKDGVKHRIVEIRTKSILKLGRAKQQTEAVSQEAEPSDVPF